MLETFKKSLGIVWEIVESASFALGIFVVVYLFLFQVNQVQGASSYPTLVTGEKFVMDKVSYLFSSPKRGDFVVLRSPENENVDFIKRIIALPGESIEISGGKVLVNGGILEEPYLSRDTVTFGATALPDDQVLTLKENEYFVMGDNREHSNDSRFFGPIPFSEIVGKADFRLWPPDRFGPL